MSMDAAALKDFQQATVDRIVHQLCHGGQRRFLVADEVGLGKTLVARGVIEQFARTRPSLRVVYICSNTAIAGQNLRKLAPQGCRVQESLATRLTLLALHAGKMDAEGVSLIAFTPGTSFDQAGGGGGLVDERVLLLHLLDEAWNLGGAADARNLMAEWVGLDRFKERVDKFNPGRIDPAIASNFRSVLRTDDGRALRREFNKLRQFFPCSRSKLDEGVRTRRWHWLGKARRLLARAGLERLQPDLIVLDEFQRFRDLLGGESEAAQLAGDLFDHTGPEGRETCTLLLSATPYKMLSLHGETEDDHFRDLMRTLNFLNRGADWPALLRSWQSCLHDLGDRAALRESRDQLAAALRRVMSRTERDANSGNLRETRLEAQTLAPEDVRGWMALQKIADHFDTGTALEYWKSAPYALNFMEGDRYLLKQKLLEACKDRRRQERTGTLIRQASSAFLPHRDFKAWKPVPAPNGALRGLIAQTLEAGAWQLLWTPPCLPCYAARGVFSSPAAASFTKSLVFSSWHMVPKTLASLVSYEAARRMIASHPGDDMTRNTPEEWKKLRPLLRFSRSEGRETGLPLLLLVYPCLAFARELDPLILPGATWEEKAAAAREKIDLWLRPLQSKAGLRGNEDERWYWLAPLLIDQARHRADAEAWWRHDSLAADWLREEEEENGETGERTHVAWDKHVAAAREALENPPGLGRAPADLLDVLTLAALAGPASCALRALARAEEITLQTRLAAGQAGHAFLSLFNAGEVREMLLGLNPAEPYWLRVLEYCRDGVLQSVLDEYFHLVRGDHADPAASLISALRLHASTAWADVITAAETTGEVRVNLMRSGEQGKGLPFRLRFARRFGDRETGEDSGGKGGKEKVRQAFNSPFWPFVLVSTSVGQEGLDFHYYCHRVIHWNLPSNPVDLEQREGRVNRHKNHAVRKNIAATHGAGVDIHTVKDPWQSLFTQAAATRPPGANELFPAWIFPGPAAIERCVPRLPLSRESTRLPALRRALTLYRMAFGHSRQEDIIEHLAATLPEEEHEALLAELRLDLSPPCTLA